VVYAFRSLSSSFRRMSYACTHRKILPAITPRNAGGISPRARPSKNLLTFFLSDEKESKQRKNRPSAVFFYTHSLFTPSWYSSDLILKPSCLHLCLSHVAIHSFIRKATAIHCGMLLVPFIPFAEYPFLLLRFLCFNSKSS